MSSARWAPISPKAVLGRTSIRRLIFDRQRGRCFFCTEPMAFDDATLDHLLGKGWRGPNPGGEPPMNTTLACSLCNSLKGNRPPTRAECLAFIEMVEPIARWAGRVVHPNILFLSTAPDEARRTKRAMRRAMEATLKTDTSPPPDAATAVEVIARGLDPLPFARPEGARDYVYQRDKARCRNATTKAAKVAAALAAAGFAIVRVGTGGAP